VFVALLVGFDWLGYLVARLLASCQLSRLPQLPGSWQAPDEQMKLHETHKRGTTLLLLTLGDNTLAPSLHKRTKRAESRGSRKAEMPKCRKAETKQQ
jgi:hypothetical protein